MAKTLEDCLDDITDDAYAYTQTMLEFVDADKVEGLLKAMCQAMQLKNVDDMKVYAMCLANSVNDAMTKRAETMMNKPNPLNEYFDEVDAQLNRLTIRSAA